MKKQLDFAVVNYVLAKTKKGYSSATRNYVAYVKAMGTSSPFPASQDLVSSWILFLGMTTSVSSIKVYLSALRYTHGSLGSHWSLDGNEKVRRSYAFVKRTYGMAAKSLKMPITLGLLRIIFPRLQGWPLPASMSHDDRVFVTASVIGVLGFLRGGEFLASAGSSRPILMGKDVRIVSSCGSEAVEVSVRQPKARWWLESVSVLCFMVPSLGPLNPVGLLQAMRALSVVPMGPSFPAFRLSDGSALSRNFMVRKTGNLLREAGVSFLPRLGSPISVKASSWRAGGACSAKRALISDSMIQQQGRWASMAFLRYLEFSTAYELKAAVCRMGVQARVDERSGADVLSAQVGQRSFPSAEVSIASVARGAVRLRPSGHRQAGAVPMARVGPSPHRRASNGNVRSRRIP